MLREGRINFQTVFLAILVSVAKFSHSWPLSTNSRWIVDQATGNRVKLACGNWPSHLQPMIAEGLEKKPLSHIVEKIASMGFNCVRFTWATYMFTRASYSNLTVAQSLDNFGLKDAKAGIAKNNPELLNLSVIDVHKAVVDELGANKLMVVLDNHVSLPQWCCSNDDGNGFFGDTYFDPQEWLQGLKAVALRYLNNSAVIGMSMRNELRGLRQNENDWYKYMAEGASAIHEVNPDFLVIVSGLSFDTTLSFLRQKSLGVNITNKLVYEAHWYAFGEDDGRWISETNLKCAKRTQDVMSNAFFLVTGNNPVPLFLSEFGINQSGGIEKENRYLICLLARIAELDIDWALWALQGSYMLRQGTVEMEEYYGMFDYNWDNVRNATMLERLQLVQQMNQDGEETKDPTNFIMYHPQSGQCVNIHKGKIKGASCQNSWRWKHEGDGSPIGIEGTASCLRANGEGLPAVVSDDCTSEGSKWKSVSASKLHLAAQDKKGDFLCLERNEEDSTIVTNKCLCLQDNLTDVQSCGDNPQIQWFKLVPTNIEASHIDSF